MHFKNLRMVSKICARFSLAHRASFWLTLAAGFLLVSCERQCGEGYAILFGLGPKKSGPECADPHCLTDRTTQMGGGDGSAENPYQVCSAEHLNEIRNKPMDSHYKQTKDIDLSSWGNWDPIDDGAGGYFSGTYDGQGLTIRNLSMVYAWGSGLEDFVGLFSRLSAQARVRNLNVTDAHVRGRDSVGSIAGQLNGGIDNVRVNVNIEGRNEVGGVVGAAENGSQISRAQATGSVSSSVDPLDSGSSVGLVAGSSNGSLSRTSSFGSVVGFNHVGGLIGEATGGAIVDSYSWASITIDDAGYAGGGLVGLLWSVTVTSSMASANITGLPAAVLGGLIGDVALGSTPIITASYWNSTIFATSPAGGTARTETQLRDLTTYDSTLWNFSTTWKLDPSMQLPRLRFE